jgi:hypothetical protein
VDAHKGLGQRHWRAKGRNRSSWSPGHWHHKSIRCGWRWRRCAKSGDVAARCGNASLRARDIAMKNQSAECVPMSYSIYRMWQSRCLLRLETKAVALRGSLFMQSVSFKCTVTEISGCKILSWRCAFACPVG